MARAAAKLQFPLIARAAAWQDERIRMIFTLAKRLEGVVNAEMKAPCEIELEKVYCPHIIFRKKRYAGLKHDKPDSVGKVDKRGVECERRGVIVMVSEVVSTVIDSMIATGDIEEAAAIVRCEVRSACASFFV